MDGVIGIRESGIYAYSIAVDSAVFLFFFLLFDFHLFLKRPALCNIQFSLSPLFGIVIRMYCIIIGIKFIRIKMCTL